MVEYVRASGQVRTSHVPAHAHVRHRAHTAGAGSWRAIPQATDCVPKLSCKG